MKINWKSLGAGAAAILGVLAQNAGQLPHNVATAVTIAGVLVAMFTRPAVSTSAPPTTAAQ